MVQDHQDARLDRLAKKKVGKEALQGDAILARAREASHLTKVREQKRGHSNDSDRER